MPDASFAITFAGPLVTVQDAGRPGNLRYGVPTSGPMDRLAYQAANAALGNPPGCPAVEVSLGGLMLTCTSGPVTVAITGGDFTIDHAGHKLNGWVTLTLHKGERLAIRAGAAGSWAYLAFAGRLQATEWLGSLATHSTSGFGGGSLTTGDRLTIRDAALRDDRLGAIPTPDARQNAPIRVVPGPQDQHFDDTAMSLLLSNPFKVSDAYDRMGMRLTGPLLKLGAALSIPSEPITRGSMQVSGDSVPTVLLADHQTTGGYPKIATVISCDIDRLVQHRAGDPLRFDAISSAEAVAATRSHLQNSQAYLDEIAIPRGSLEQRLMRENLIHGWVDEPL